MTPRTLWTIVVKILGLCIGYQLLSTIWATVSITISYSTIAAVLDKNYSHQFISIAMFGSLVVLVLYVLSFYFFLFKTEFIIDKLKLDKGYLQERFEFNLPGSTILKIVLMIIGGWLLVNITADLIKEFIIYFQKLPKYGIEAYNRNTIFIVFDIIKIIIGVLMITCSDKLASLLNKKSKDIIDPVL